jgi:hypothetical protein
VEPAQQGVPGSPQREQTCELGLQAVLGAVQTLPGQQASPGFPQATQAVPLQRVLAAVQAPPGQHGCPGPPQEPQEPLAQLPGSRTQLAPVATQVQPTQQPPPLQALPGQQGPPGVPHATAPPSCPTKAPSLEVAGLSMGTSPVVAPMASLAGGGPSVLGLVADELQPAAPARAAAKRMIDRVIGRFFTARPPGWG